MSRPTGDKLKTVTAILNAVGDQDIKLSCREIERLEGVRNGTIGKIERTALKKVHAGLVGYRVGRVQIQARDSASVIAFSVPSALPSLAASDPMPEAIIWMPAGVHAITACTLDGKGYSGTVICDEQAARVVASHLATLKAKGKRTWIDFNHEDGAASADIKAFSWDPAKGIMAHLDWTPGGEKSVRDKEFISFSPAFEANRTTGRIESLIEGHALGGLVNAPAFDAMPALIAARYGLDASHRNPHPEDNPESKNMKETLLKILAALKVTPPANATEDQLVDLLAKHIDGLAPSEEVVKLKAQLTDLKTAADAEKTASVQAKKDADVKIAEMERKMTETAAVLAGFKAGADGVRVVVTQEDMTDVLAAYASKDPSQFPANEHFAQQRAELAVDRALIYARNIKPRLFKNRERASIRAALADLLSHAGVHSADIVKIVAKATTRLQIQANTLGTLSGSLIAQQALSLLKADLPALSMFTADFSNAAAKLNQTVITRIRSIPAVQSYAAPPTGYAATAVTDTDVPVTIDQHRYVQFDYNANELASTNRDLFGEQAEGSIYALGKDVVDFILALVTVGNFNIGGGKSTVAQSAWTRSAVIAQRVALRKRKVMIKDGFAIMNEDYFGQLAVDPVIATLATFQRPDLITEYVLPKIAGFMPVGYVDLPTTSNLVAVLGSKEALVVAARLPYDYVDAQIGSNYGAVSQVSDPDTGLSVMLTQYVNHDAGASRYRVALMYGSAVGDKTRAQLVVSA
jgi:phage I-like protein